MAKRLTTDEWVARARATHGDRYGYSKVEYVNKNTKVTIVCRVHGDFQQKAVSHAHHGHGCARCAWAQNGVIGRLSKTVWLERARAVHGDRHDYSKTEYVDSSVKVSIGCRVHGEFWQSPVSHVHGQRGCPDCASSSRSRGEAGVSAILVGLGVWHERQWRHPTCRDRNVLPFDFYLPTHGALIEFDGLQHYKPVKWPGMTDADAELVFRATERRDLIKSDWAKANGYPLLRVWDLDRLEDEVSRFIVRLENAALPISV